MLHPVLVEERRHQLATRGAECHAERLVLNVRAEAAGVHLHGNLRRRRQGEPRHGVGRHGTRHGTRVVTRHGGRHVAAGQGGRHGHAHTHSVRCGEHGTGHTRTHRVVRQGHTFTRRPAGASGAD